MTSQLTEGNRNYFRLQYILTQFGSKCLNELLRYLITANSTSPVSLAQFLALRSEKNDLSKCLDSRQRNLLYPNHTPSTCVGFGDLDISLACKLLKNAKKVSPSFRQPPSCPASLWDQSGPSVNDFQYFPLEANVSLLVQKRNELCHITQPTLKTDQFSCCFDKIKSAIMHIVAYISNNEKSDPCIVDADIEAFRTIELDQEVIKHEMELIIQNVEAVNELKREIEELRELTAKKVKKDTWKKPMYLLIVAIALSALALAITVFVKYEHLEDLVYKSLGRRGSPDSIPKKSGTLARIQLRKSDTTFPNLPPEVKDKLSKLQQTHSRVRHPSFHVVMDSAGPSDVAGYRDVAGPSDASPPDGSSPSTVPPFSGSREPFTIEHLLVMKEHRSVASSEHYRKHDKHDREHDEL